MKKILVVIDFQNDFIDGTLGTPEAQAIVENVVQKIQSYPKNERFATLDTHFSDYLSTQEGKWLSVLHCQKGTYGWEMRKEAQLGFERCFEKHTFGSVALAQFVKDAQVDEVELVGICTDICVVSNALLIKAFAPEVKLIVDAACCAGVSKEKHDAALETMKSCQIQVINE
ncbi:isochorismatase family protein [Lactococcus hircilactis]|uniref:Isochorismatase family protein n=1 Tax=Lactococcus hircilactis TaxID=1494462 RepID=A0A7X1Z816_9LACT|nr:isochorismatase family cysteine hydrolase [Lactococcus hircilactis]MQW39545.1 isochorismatase family protein [Lactococcus hircilactis]